MEFKNIKNKTIKVKENKTIKIINNMGTLNFIPEFKEGDFVKVTEKGRDYSSNLKKLYGYTLTVHFCKATDLGDMYVETIKLKPFKIKGKDIVQNPYLVKYFKKV